MKIENWFSKMQDAINVHYKKLSIQTQKNLLIAQQVFLNWWRRQPLSAIPGLCGTGASLSIGIGT